MKKFLILCIILTTLAILTTSTSAIDTPEIEWQRCLGGSGNEAGYSVQQTTDGGYIIAGQAESYDGDVSGIHWKEDVWVVKLDNAGIIQWQQCLGGMGKENGFFIQQTADNGYILAGQTESNDADVSGNHGSYDIWVVKLDSEGIIQWQRCLGGLGPEWGYSVQQTADSGFILSGETGSNDGDVSGNHGSRDIWVVKLNNIGIIQWQRALGGGSFEGGKNSIKPTSDGGYIVAGQTESNNGDVSGNHGLRDMWVVKLDSEGIIQWQRCLGGTENDAGFSIQQTIDGGYVVAGFTESNNGDVSGNHGNVDVWVVKLDSTGTLVWQQCLGGGGSEWGYSVQQTTDGGYVITGLTSQDLWMGRLDSTGNFLWQFSLGGTSFDLGYSVQQCTEGGYIVTGQTESNNGDVSGNHGERDVWVVKLGEDTLPVYKDSLVDELMSDGIITNSELIQVVMWWFNGEVTDSKLIQCVMIWFE